ncbi:hypothetical protein EJB05_37175, partial [Eragrostis curvula]
MAAAPFAPSSPSAAHRHQILFDRSTRWHSTFPHRVFEEREHLRDELQLPCLPVIYKLHAALLRSKRIGDLAELFSPTMLAAGHPPVIAVASNTLKWV